MILPVCVEDRTGVTVLYLMCPVRHCDHSRLRARPATKKPAACRLVAVVAALLQREPVDSRAGQQGITGIRHYLFQHSGDVLARLVQFLVGVAGIELAQGRLDVVQLPCIDRQGLGHISAGTGRGYSYMHYTRACAQICGLFGDQPAIFRQDLEFRIQI